jgi:hypothetical protein
MLRRGTPPRSSPSSCPTGPGLLGTSLGGSAESPMARQLETVRIATGGRSVPFRGSCRFGGGYRFGAGAVSRHVDVSGQVPFRGRCRFGARRTGRCCVTLSPRPLSGSGRPSRSRAGHQRGLLSVDRGLAAKPPALQARRGRITVSGPTITHKPGRWRSGPEGRDGGEPYGCIAMANHGDLGRRCSPPTRPPLQPSV